MDCLEDEFEGGQLLEDLAEQVISEEKHAPHVTGSTLGKRVPWKQGGVSGWWQASSSSETGPTCGYPVERKSKTRARLQV